MTKYFFIWFSLIFLAACGGNSGTQTQEEGSKMLEEAVKEGEKKEVHGTEIKEADIKITNPLDAQMVENGKSIYDSKCLSCHKLTDERVVGPGWKDVSKRRKPVWIMNMITNVDVMLAEDPEAQKLLEQCLVRMPNQNVTVADARSLLEFMRQNDGEK
jgi:cytochrome c2